MNSHKDYFSVWTPFNLVKGSAEDAEPMTARIGGIVSTQSKDQQGDEILQKGIDWTYALSKGWFNYEHKQGPDAVLGHPDTIEPTTHNGEPATRIEGVLYLHKPLAREIYQTAMALEKAQSDRRLGFSVEGQVVARDKAKIVKSKVLNVAITAHPVNAEARFDVLKSLAAAAGYQTPPSMGGSLSPLIPQSMANTVSNAAIDALKYRPRISIRDLAIMLADSFPGVSYADALKYASRISQSFR
tara:strand:- start:230 stop:958 length:729 start_codon:yes stop_codon:yes gene_type:complete